MNKLISKYQGGTPKLGIKLNLGVKSKAEVDATNNKEKDLALHHFSRVFSNNEGIWDGLKHLARGVQHGYNGYLDPETLYLTGAPTILPGRTPAKVPSVKKVGNMLKNKLFLRGYNRSGVKISAVPRSQVPDGETITFFKNANGTRTPKYYDKKYGHWIEVIDDVDDDVKVVGYASNAPAKPTIKPITNYNNDTLIVSNIEPYDYNNDIMMINSAFDDAYNYDPGLLDVFKKGGILPSRNPVLRFKLGKKILKFQEAGKIYYKGRDGKDYEAWRGGNDWYYRQRGTTGMTRMPYDYTTTTGLKFYSSTPRGAVANNYETVKKMYNKYGSAELLLAKLQAKTEGVIPLGGIASTRERILNRNQKNKNIRDTTSSSTKVTPQKSSYDKFIYANEGKLGGWNKSVGLGNINDLESLDIIKQLGWEGKSAEEVLNLLNSNDIGGNRVVVDNKWGNQSKAALQNYYNRWLEELKPVEQKPTIQLPEAPIAPTLLRQAISDYSNYAQNLKQALGGNSNFSGLSNLVWKEYADDDNSFAANFSRDMRTRFKDYGTLLNWLDNQAAIEKLLNISGRYRGTNNGDYGDIANSMANWAGRYNYNIDKLNLTLTNDYNKKLDYYNKIIDKYKRTVGGYKMGGLLPSRNVVERFKLGRKIIFAQGGTYFPVTVGGRTYQYNPYNGSYKGTQGSGLNISYKDIEGAFNKQYEGVSHSGSKVYRKKGSHTTWTNSTGKQVNLAPAKKAQPNTSFKTSANGRFRVVDQTSGKELRFDSRDEAKKYQMSATKLGTRVLYDDKKEGYGVLKVDRTKEKNTEWARNQRETNNNKSRAEAYKAARERGDRWFAYDGKVYSSDLKNYKNDNLTEMKAIYGNDLGWGKDPNYNTKSSAQARNAQNKEIKALNSNRNANYKGKTNKQASAEADKKVAKTWNEEDFVDALLPATAVGNGINYLASTAMGEDYHPEVFHSGLNSAVGMANLMRGEWNKVGERALNAASVFGGPWIGKGVKWLGTRMAPEIANLGSKSAYLSQRATVPVANGTGRTLNKMAERAVSGNFTSPTTTYGRYSLQKAADKGLLDQFATNGGFNNAARWGDRLVRNNNTGTGYIFRSGTTHPYDATVDAGTKVIPWVTSFGLPTASTTLHNLTEE